MPRRDDIHSILVIGAGPIVIGQACEFDYSGTQACRVLREEGYRVILLNSNPATIMTDPEFADATYVEPLTFDFAKQVIEREKPDALLPTVGGQVGLNLSLELHEKGVLKEHNVELIGANPEAIAVAEDRDLFKKAMVEIGMAPGPGPTLFADRLCSKPCAFPDFGLSTQMQALGRREHHRSGQRQALFETSSSSVL